MRSKQKALGQVLTAPMIAQYMVDLAYDPHIRTVLDPALGEGIFLQCLRKKDQRLDFSACEVDPEMIARFQAHDPAPVRLYPQDYLGTSFQNQFDLIICNPPYNKFQNIPCRKEYIAAFQRDYGIHLNGYSNLCVYFLLKSLHELNAGGKCAYIVPYEFLNTGYGFAVKKYILESRMLKTVVQFSNNLNLFSGAITTSCILLFENRPQETVEFARIDSMEQVRAKTFSHVRSYPYDELNPKEKWNQYFTDPAQDQYRNLVVFSSVAKVKRGIATGSNAYFSLSKKQIEHLGLSSRAYFRCIAKSANVSGSVFTDEDFDALSREGKKVYLFDGEKAKTNQDFAYIRQGERQGVDKAYLTSHRSPWYQTEQKDPAPIWISVFSRSRLKIIRNETDAKNLTTFHGIYVKNTDQAFQNLFFCYLLTPICQKILLENKREYGDGLDKFEPNDLNNAKVMDVSILSKEDVQAVLGIYEQIKATRSAEAYISELNTIFSKYMIT